MEIRKELRWFVEQMEMKLKANDHRGGWHNEYTEFFLARMNDEYRELVTALEQGDFEAAITECADLANFAMMLADHLHRYGIVSNGWLKREAGKLLANSTPISEEMATFGEARQ
jgi:NTP pyrophosphatase (non-canonical NTP hydrolase)